MTDERILTVQNSMKHLWQLKEYLSSKTVFNIWKMGEHLLLKTLCHIYDRWKNTYGPKLYEVFDRWDSHIETVDEPISQKQDKELVVGKPHAVVHPVTHAKPLCQQSSQVCKTLMWIILPSMQYPDVNNLSKYAITWCEQSKSAIPFLSTCTPDVNNLSKYNFLRVKPVQ